MTSPSWPCAEGHRPRLRQGLTAPAPGSGADADVLHDQAEGEQVPDDPFPGQVPLVIDPLAGRRTVRWRKETTLLAEEAQREGRGACCGRGVCDTHTRSPSSPGQVRSAPPGCRSDVPGAVPATLPARDRRSAMHLQDGDDLSCARPGRQAFAPLHSGAIAALIAEHFHRLPDEQERPCTPRTPCTAARPRQGHPSGRLAPRPRLGERVLPPSRHVGDQDVHGHDSRSPDGPC